MHNMLEGSCPSTLNLWLDQLISSLTAYLKNDEFFPINAISWSSFTLGTIHILRPQNYWVGLRNGQFGRCSVQWNLNLRKTLGVTKIFLKSRFFLISNTRKPLKKHNFAKWTSETIQIYYCFNIVNCFWLYVFVDIFIP